MSYVGAISDLIFTPVLWGLSHKYFRFIYFGNMGVSILRELIECLFISLLIVSVIGAFGMSILDFIGSALIFLLKAVLVIGIIAIVIVGISKIIKK